MSGNELFKLDKKRQSQLDPGGVLKSAHDDLSQSIRVVNGVTEVPTSYSRVQLSYNAQGSVTRAVFYEGTQARITELTAVADVFGSLNNTYIVLYSENNESLYHLWFNVGGLGTDPAPSGSIGIEVPIDTNDSKEIVALAISLALKHITDFCVQLCDPKVFIENARKGASDAIADFGTGFSLTVTQQGSERLLKSIDIPYDGKTKYLFNTQDKNFEVESVNTLTVDFSSITAQEPFISNITLGLAGVESSLALPVDTIKFRIKARDKSKLQFSFNSGQSGSNFITIKKGAVFLDEGLELTSVKTIYIQAPNDDNEVVEIIYWT